MVEELPYASSTCGRKSGDPSMLRVNKAPHSKVLRTWLKPGIYTGEAKRGYLVMPRSKSKMTST